MGDFDRLQEALPARPRRERARLRARPRRHRDGLLQPQRVAAGSTTAPRIPAMEHRYLNAALLLNRIDCDFVFVCSLAPDPEVLAYYRDLVSPDVARPDGAPHPHRAGRRPEHALAGREAARPPRPARRDPRARRRAHRRHRAVERHRARGGRRRGPRRPDQRHRARPALDGVQERRAQAVPPHRRARAAGPRGRPQRRRRRRGGGVDPGVAPHGGCGRRQARRQRGRRRQRRGAPAGRRPAPHATRTSCWPTSRRCRSGSSTTSRRAGESSRRWSSATPCAARACRSTCCPAVASGCSPPTTRCSAASNGQVYLGCRFPADPAYAADLAAHGDGGRPRARRAWLRRPGRRRLHGRAHGRPAVVAHRPGGEPAQGRHHAPLLGAAQPGAGALRHRGRRRGSRTPTAAPAPTAPPTTSSTPSLAERSPQSVIDAVREAGLQFDADTGTGVVLHMLGCLAVDGRFGATAIGRTPRARRRAVRGHARRRWCRAGPTRVEPTR